DRRADLLDDAGVLATHRPWPLQLLDPAVRPQVRPADAGRRQPDDGIGPLQEGRLGAGAEARCADSRVTASVRFRMVGSARSSTRTSPGAVITATRMEQTPRHRGN